MSHFSAAQWFEYVSRAGSSEGSVLIERHLGEDCGECHKFLEFWRSVIEIARREPNYRPSELAVASAKAMFEPEEPWRWFSQIAQVAKVLLDSFREPMPAAVRGSMTSSRQLLQEAKPFVIDVRLEYESARKRVRMIGQVVNSKEPAKSVSDVDIFLLDGERLAARATANSSGEFQLEFSEEAGLQLFVDIRGQKVVEILLPSSPGYGHGAAAGAD